MSLHPRLNHVHSSILSPDDHSEPADDVPYSSSDEQVVTRRFIPDRRAAGVLPPRLRRYPLAAFVPDGEPGHRSASRSSSAPNDPGEESELGSKIRTRERKSLIVPPAALTTHLGPDVKHHRLEGSQGWHAGSVNEVPHRMYTQTHVTAARLIRQVSAIT
jgi:hypothetical protein